MKHVRKNDLLTANQNSGNLYQPTISDPIVFACESASRHWRVILFSIFLAVLLGVVYLLLATPVFTAKSAVALDTQRAAPYSGQSDGVEELFIDTQFEELRSDKSLLAVIDTLKLWETPRFKEVATRSSYNVVLKFFSKVRDRLSLSSISNSKHSADPKVAFERHRIRILDQLRDWLKVVRVGKSFLAEIYFTTPDPKLSSLLANYLADVYLSDRNSRLEQSSDWIQKRTEEIGKRMQDAFRAVENFKLENNVVLDNDGKLTGERELEALSGMRDLIAAEALEMESRLQTLRENLSYPADGKQVVIERLLKATSFMNPALTALKQRLKSALEEISGPEKRLIKNNTEKESQKQKLIEIHRELLQIFKKRIPDYESATEETKSRRARIEERFSRVFEQTNAARQTLAKLRELETQGEILKTLYSSYLNRQIQNIEQTVFPISQARIMSRAHTPVEPSAPRTSIVMLLSSITGAMLGFGAGLLIDYRRPVVITRPGTLEDVFGPMPIRIMPRLGHLKGVDGVRNYQGSCYRKSEREAEARASDLLLSIKLAIDDNKFGKSRPAVVGVSSAKTGQGASTLAYNLAEFASLESVRILLIDADSHRQTLTKSLFSEGGPGLADALGDVQDFNQYTERLNERIAFLGAPTSEASNFPARLVSSKEMQSLLRAAKENYDYIIVDLPSILENSETQFSVGLIDKFVLNIEYGRTTLEEFSECIRKIDPAGDKILSVVINKSRKV